VTRADRAPALAEIDWSRPWLARWRARGQPLAAQALRCGVAAALDAAGGDGLAPGASRRRFVDPTEPPAGEAYESFIARTARVPTRENLHDFFNGLAWLVHPGLKQRLNALQAEQIARSGPAPIRGAVRDALTLFDENAALMQAPSMLIDALRRRDWHALFVQHRAAWVQARIELFGHALIEKLVRPRPPITAHVWLVPSGVVDMAGWMAGSLDPVSLATRPFLPLPVLGVPGWWPDNAAPGFYLDTSVFRPPGTRPAAGRPLG
jgi:hypothetical protein